MGALQGLEKHLVTPTGHKEPAKTLGNVDVQNDPDIKSDNSTAEQRLIRAFRQLNPHQRAELLSLAESQSHVQDEVESSCVSTTQTAENHK